MIHQFTKDNIETIAKVLDCTPKPLGNDVFRFELRAEQARLALEVHLGLEVQGKKMNMVSVYAYNTVLQLHNCTAFVASDILNQVTFFGRNGDNTTGLVVDKSASCSMYANVDESVITGDFTKLPEDLMMCGISLSLTENMDDDFTF